MQGGMIVAGLVTGGHFIEDIQVSVPHKVAVWIPAEKALGSKDLYRALGQNLLFKLDGGGISADTAPPVDSNESKVLIAGLESEIRSLKVQNSTLTQQNTLLTQLLTGLQQQMETLSQGITRLEAKPSVVTVTNSPGISTKPAQSTPVVSEVVGGEVPTFLPSTGSLKDVETQINITTQVSEESPVNAANSKLRELRKKSGNG